MSVLYIASHRCSDMVPGVHNPQQTLPRSAPQNGFSQTELAIPKLTVFMTKIHHLRSSMGGTQPKILQTQVPFI